MKIFGKTYRRIEVDMHYGTTYRELFDEQRAKGAAGRAWLGEKLSPVVAVPKVVVAWLAVRGTQVAGRVTGFVAAK